MTQARINHATFVIEHHYSATPKRVFAAFADPRKKRRWFAEGEGFALDSYELDFRVGGIERSRFRFMGDGPVEQGAPMGNDTYFHDIVPDQRIIFSYAMTLDDTPFSCSLATIELRHDSQGTLLVFTEQAAFLENADGPQTREAGWRELLDSLGRHLAH